MPTHVYGTSIFKINYFENGLEMEFKKYPVTINSFRHHNGGITMKTLKNATHRFFAFVLAFAMAVGIFSSTTAFAAEASKTKPVTENMEVATSRVTNLMSGSTHDYVTGNKVLGSFTIPKDTWGIVPTQLVTIAYVYEDLNHSHNAKLVFRSSNSSASIYLTPSAKLETTTLNLNRNENFTVTIEPGCTGEYMASVSVYY